MARVVLVVLLVTAALVALIWGFQRHLIYLPDRGEVRLPAALDPLAREVRLATSDGESLGAWFVAAGERDRGFAVLVANGNGGNRALRAPLAQVLSREGFSVLLFDYRGYGDSSGSPDEAGLREDVRAARAYLVNEAGFDPGRLIYFGESLGAAVVTELAVEHPPAGLLLRSPFTDLAAVGQIHYPLLPVRLLLRDRFPVVEHIGKIDIPVAVVYGTRDGIVPPEQSLEVAEAAGDVTQIVSVSGADHNDEALLTGPELIRAVVALSGDASQSDHAS